MPGRYRVPGGLYWQTRCVQATRSLWVSLGNLESRVLRADIDGVEIVAPIYVCGLARSGTTMLTEILNAHPEVTSHRYADFPVAFTPYWRNWLRARSQVAAPRPVERAHQDRIEVTQDSPEAVEEVIWMHYFPRSHDPRRDQRLDAATRAPAFEAFYRDHIRKLLLVRHAQRYLAKGNYNVTRLAYLRRLFPDARFVLACRDPLHHIASLHKQHRLFSEGQGINPRMRFQLGASGHFEFGLDRVPINWGDDGAVEQILTAWAEGQEVRGWALYWAGLYGWLLETLERDAALAEAVRWVSYESLCKDSGPVIDDLLRHCRLSAGPFGEQRAHFSGLLSLPAYYQPDFDAAERQLIADLTGPVAERLARRSRAASPAGP